MVYRRATLLNYPGFAVSMVYRGATLLSCPGFTVSVVYRRATILSYPGFPVSVVYRGATLLSYPGFTVSVVYRGAILFSYPGFPISMVYRGVSLSLLLLSDVLDKAGIPSTTNYFNWPQSTILITFFITDESGCTGMLQVVATNGMPLKPYIFSFIILLKIDSWADINLVL